jgi:hypothetical protein
MCAHTPLSVYTQIDASPLNPSRVVLKILASYGRF